MKATQELEQEISESVGPQPLLFELEESGLF